MITWLVYIVKYLVLITLLASCAWNKENLVVKDLPQQDLTKSFSVEDDVLEKFSESPKQNEEAKKTSKEETKEAIKTKAAKVTKAKSSKVKKQTNIQKEQTSVVEKNSTIFPEDYPEELKKNYAKYKKLWKTFRPKFFVGEEYEFDASYLGVTAAKAVIRTLPPKNVGGRDVYHVGARVQTAPFYRYIYELQDNVESYIDMETFLPIKYQLTQRESAQKVDDLQLFDHEQLKTFVFYKREKKGSNRDIKLEKPIPPFFQDSFSVLYFVRGLPIKKGETISFPVMTRGKWWILKYWIDGYETIEANKEKISAVRIKAETHYPGVLKKRGDIFFWFSNDETKRLLQFRAKVKIGSIYGYLVRYVKGKQP